MIDVDGPWIRPEAGVARPSGTRALFLAVDNATATTVCPPVVRRSTTASTATVRVSGPAPTRSAAASTENERGPGQREKYSRDAEAGDRVVGLDFAVSIVVDPGRRFVVSLERS